MRNALPFSSEEEPIAWMVCAAEGVRRGRVMSFVNQEEMSPVPRGLLVFL